MEVPARIFSPARLSSKVTHNFVIFSHLARRPPAISHVGVLLNKHNIIIMHYITPIRTHTRAHNTSIRNNILLYGTAARSNTNGSGVVSRTPFAFYFCIIFFSFIFSAVVIRRIAVQICASSHISRIRRAPIIYYTACGAVQISIHRRRLEPNRISCSVYTINIISFSLFLNFFSPLNPLKAITSRHPLLALRRRG